MNLRREVLGLEAELTLDQLAHLLHEPHKGALDTALAVLGIVQVADDLLQLSERHGHPR